LFSLCSLVGVSRTSVQQQSANIFGFLLPLFLFPIQHIYLWNHSSCSSEKAPHIYRKKSRWKRRKWRFNDMLLPQTRYEESSSSTISQKFGSYVFKRVPGSSLGRIQFILEIGVLKNLFHFRTDENSIGVDTI
jgi:hypothetical protein